MKKLVVLALAVMLMIPLTACGAATKSGDTAAMPASSSSLEGEDYQDAVTSLRSAGFTNVTTATIDDLIVGWLTKDGEVEKVSVNGATDFQANSGFPKDAEIVVTYHTFPKEAADPAEETRSATVENRKSATTTATEDTTTTTAETTTTTATEDTTTTSAETMTTASAEGTTTTAGAGLELSIAEVTSPVPQGSLATVRAKTAPGADCSIVVMYKTGESTAKGLEAKKADSAGNVSWTWKVGPKTSHGPHPISVTASMDGQSVTEQTSFAVE